MQNFDAFFPTRSAPRNPYRHTEYRRPNQTLQERFFLIVGTVVCFLCFMAFTSTKLAVSTTHGNGLPPANALHAAAPRLKGAMAAELLSTPLTMKIMTFNLRFASAHDGFNSWQYRKAHLIELINRYHPAIMGTQEGLRDQLTEIAASLEHPYDRFGVEREVNGEFEQIFYDTNIVERLDGGNFWLSEQPDTAGTKGWDAACVRLVTWCKFRLLATGQVFFFFNTQLDHVGARSRDEGTKLLWQRIQQITGSESMPFFLVGDFNTYRHTDTYKYLTTAGEGPQLKEAWMEAKEQIGTVSYTYHGWAGVNNDNERGAVPAANHIDWILYRPQMSVLSTEVITESRNGRYPSDHYPIQAEVLFPSAQELPPPSA